MSIELILGFCGGFSVGCAYCVFLLRGFHSKEQHRSEKQMAPVFGFSDHDQAAYMIDAPPIISRR
jgi:hypothetical protein